MPVGEHVVEGRFQPAGEAGLVAPFGAVEGVADAAPQGVQGVDIEQVSFSAAAESDAEAFAEDNG